mmetsp:Transcript_150576/g.484176  ORF Transcript_150576/g.484176 Transcript_150576/m.484176 type:complete len:421 (+) Transcript_150576:1680-2942(+)
MDAVRRPSYRPWPSATTTRTRSREWPGSPAPPAATAPSSTASGWRTPSTMTSPPASGARRSSPWRSPGSGRSKPASQRMSGWSTFLRWKSACPPSTHSWFTIKTSFPPMWQRPRVSSSWSSREGCGSCSRGCVSPPRASSRCVTKTSPLAIPSSSTCTPKSTTSRCSPRKSRQACQVLKRLKDRPPGASASARSTRNQLRRATPRRWAHSRAACRGVGRPVHGSQPQPRLRRLWHRPEPPVCTSAGPPSCSRLAWVGGCRGLPVLGLAAVVPARPSPPPPLLRRRRRCSRPPRTTGRPGRCYRSCRSGKRRWPVASPAFPRSSLPATPQLAPVLCQRVLCAAQATSTSSTSPRKKGTSTRCLWRSAWLVQAWPHRPPRPPCMWPAAFWLARRCAWRSRASVLHWGGQCRRWPLRCAPSMS